MQTFFHADDLGATLSVSKQILYCWRLGKISGFSVLANGDACDYVAEVLAEEIDLDARIAAHLNLSEGRCSAPQEDVQLLVDEEGYFNLSFERLLKLKILSSRSQMQVLIQQVKIEWRAQILQVQKICGLRKVLVLDGHQHIHMLPFLFPVAIQLAKEFNIPSVRISRELFYFAESWQELFSKDFLINVVKHFILRYCARIAVPLAATAKLSFAERVLGVLYSGHMSGGAIQHGIRAAEKKGILDLEVILHVGKATPQEMTRWSKTPAIGSFYLSKNRDLEFENILSYRQVAEN
jgi:predicted glycoside hydrolase/deacetylase ChbG (UPF0249 family)